MSILDQIAEQGRRRGFVSQLSRLVKQDAPRQ
jgi:hypothetical protein